jgi:hypothetical protein
MIAAYRAERLARRSVWHASVDDSDVAPRGSGDGEPPGNEPLDGVPMVIAPSVGAVAEETPIEPAPVPVSFVSPAVARQPDDVAARPDGPPASVPALSSPRVEVGPASSGYVEIDTVEPQHKFSQDDIIGSFDAVPTRPPDDGRPESASTPIQTMRLGAGAPIGSGYDPPLAEIGFGPGMVIRLGQLGLRTVSDLARADADQIRSDLGEISRLVDVDAWIRSARQIKSATPAFHGAFEDGQDP